MSSEDSDEGLSSDPADLFVQLYDRLDQESLSNPDTVAAWLENPDLRDVSDRIEHEALEWGLDPGDIGPALSAGDPGVLVAHLIGLERALRYAHPFVRTHAPNQINEIAVRYRVTGRFNSSAIEGALLPRFASPRQVVVPVKPADLFEDVIRVPPNEWSQAEHVRIPTAQDVIYDVDSTRLPVAVAPLLTSLDEVDLSVVERTGRRFFRLAPLDSREIRDRIARTLQEMDQSGAHVGVFPEATLTAELADYWAETIRATAPPDGRGLDWVLIGTGSVEDEDPPRNTAVLMNRRTGERISTQDKIHPFVLSSSQMDEWALIGRLGEEPAQEDIRTGSSLRILESAIGRLAVLICEDLSQVINLGPILAAHGVSIILAPVFSAPINQFYWEHVKAREYIAQVGATTVVANSMVIAGNLGLDRAGTALRVSPDEPPELVISTRGDEVASVSVPFREGP